jgi:hypothetical protein
VLFFPELAGASLLGAIQLSFLGLKGVSWFDTSFRRTMCIVPDEFQPSLKLRLGKATERNGKVQIVFLEPPCSTKSDHWNEKSGSRLNAAEQGWDRNVPSLEEIM